jgi:hypothetical protein
MSNCTTDYHTVPIQEKPSLKRRKSWLVGQLARLAGQLACIISSSSYKKKMNSKILLYQ